MLFNILFYFLIFNQLIILLLLNCFLVVYALLSNYFCFEWILGQNFISFIIYSSFFGFDSFSNYFLILIISYALIPNFLYNKYVYILKLKFLLRSWTSNTQNSLQFVFSSLCWLHFSVSLNFQIANFINNSRCFNLLLVLPWSYQV